MPELWMKDNKVLTFREEEGAAVAVGKIENPELLPLCLSKECTVEKFNEWMARRSMPENREGLQEEMALFDPKFGSAWHTSINKASLSDQYWVKYRLEEWRNVNYFTRKYSHDIGDMAFLPWTMHKRKVDRDSPDLTTNGVLRKRWRQENDRTSCLIKAGSRATHQEPLSEILVSVLLEQLKIIPFVRYDFWVEGTTMCSICKNFVTPDTELVPASYIYHLKPRAQNRSVYSHLLMMCEEFGIEGAQEFIDGMIFIDTITGNEDRNLGNICFIRDVNTLKLSTGPLFDFGAAYWSSGKINNSVKSKTFGDVEKRIFQRMKNRCDISFLVKNDGYKRCIESYPNISMLKKQNLITAIGKRNKTLCLERQMELDR